MSKDDLPYLEEVFNDFSNEMLSNFEKVRKAIKHKGKKGEAVENIVKKFLRDYLPENLGICSGEVLDSKGNHSRELDVIIYDAQKTPIFFKSEDSQVIPVECVYAVIEVKTLLNKAELNKIYVNMDSVKKLEKTAYYPEGVIKHHVTLYGKKWTGWPINYFVFAFDSIKPRGIVSSIIKRDDKESREFWNRIDLICIMKQGVIYPAKDKTFPLSHDEGTKMVFLKTSKALLLFYSLSSRLFNQMLMPRFNLTPYIQNVDF